MNFPRASISCFEFRAQAAINIIGRVINNNIAHDTVRQRKARGFGTRGAWKGIKKRCLWIRRLGLASRSNDTRGHDKPIGQSKRYYLNDRELEHSIVISTFCLYG